MHLDADLIELIMLMMFKDSKTILMGATILNI